MLEEEKGELKYKLAMDRERLNELENKKEEEERGFEKANREFEYSNIELQEARSRENELRSSIKELKKLLEDRLEALRVTRIGVLSDLSKLILKIKKEYMLESDIQVCEKLGCKQEDVEVAECEQLQLEQTELKKQQENEQQYNFEEEEEDYDLFEDYKKTEGLPICSLRPLSPAEVRARAIRRAEELNKGKDCQSQRRGRGR